MEKKQIKVFTNFNGITQNNEFLAIKDEFVIKYIDLENNKMVIDMLNDTIERENKDYLFYINLSNSLIEITIKKLRMKMKKKIELLLIEKKKKSYLVRYRLIDEDEVNEYYVNF